MKRAWVVHGGVRDVSHAGVLTYFNVQIDGIIPRNSGTR